jgi:hypothetical protein
MDTLAVSRGWEPSRPKSRRGAVTIAVAILVVALALLASASWMAPPAHAADRGTVVQAGGDVTIAQQDVADAVVSIGGNVDVAGTVKTAILAVGGDVRLEQTAVVGSQGDAGDTSIVLVGGTLTRAPGAQVTGDVSNVSGSWAGDLWSRGVTDQITNPYSGLSLIAWLGGTLIYLLVAVIVAALAPRQTTAVQNRVARRFWTSLGWGALSLMVIVPVITVILAVTIIGLLAIPPWLLLVVAAFILGGVAVAVLLGDWVLPRLGYKGESLVLAGIVGVLILRIITLIPIAGGIVVGLASLAGFGATVVALWSWQRHRHELARERGASPESRAA